MQRLKVFLLTAINAVYAKFKNLALHIIKHPLSSIWWAVKMYFALMFLSLFVACSFGAFASTQCPSGSQLNATHGCIIPAPIKPMFIVKIEGVTGDQAETVEKAFASTASKFASTTIDEGKDGFCDYKTTSTRSIVLTSIGNFNEIKYLRKTSSSTTYSTTHSGITCPTAQPSFNDSPWTTYPIDQPASPYCPPDDYPDFLTKVLINTTTYCSKILPPQNQCFKDPKYSIANQYHFAPEDEGKGSVCVPSDNGQLCQWKELAGSNGVFQPDTDAPDSACDDKPPSNPLDPVPPPPDCTTTPSGMKVCKEDPNEKCTANSSGAMDCPQSCGYYNQQFVCFENPEVPPEEPEEPDTPRPPADDNIENPDKPLQDMLKKDFKDVQRGVETRLDGFAADMANLLKAEKKSNDDANKSNLQSNKLLNSINQNTGDTVKELKKLTEAGEVVAGIEKPEFEEKNDWQARNFGTVMKAKGDEIMNLPIMQAINNFFDVSFSGSCPTYAVSVWVFEINIDQFCSPQVQALFPYISAVVLLMCSFFAIRIALL